MPLSYRLKDNPLKQTKPFPLQTLPFFIGGRGMPLSPPERLRNRDKKQSAVPYFRL